MTPKKATVLSKEEEEQEVGETITLLVLERGAEWPSWGTGIRLRAPNSAVEVQMDSESTEEFAERVAGRLARLASESMRLCAVGYACALEPAERHASRRDLCIKILESLADENGAELVIAGGAWEPTGVEGQRRSQLIELWSELSVRVPGRLVSVRFEDPPSESGVFRAAPILSAPPPASSQTPKARFSESEHPTKPNDYRGP